jgi:diguanylate cyclase
MAASIPPSREPAFTAPGPLAPAFAARAMPENERSEEVFRNLLQGIAVVAGLTHASFLALFLWAGVDVLAVVNVASVMCYVWIFFLARGGQIGKAWFLTVFEVLTHAMLATFVIGWDSSFHYYILLVIPVAVVSPMRPLLFKGATVLAVAGLYIGLDVAMRNAGAPHRLSAAVIDGLHYFNVFGTMLILTFLAGCYYYLIDKAHTALRTMAATDPLTQLHNRRSVIEIIGREESRLRRAPQQQLSFVLCDLDHFKGINDSRGHETGDVVLKAVSRALSASIRDIDHLARWGGEEFLAVLPDTDAASAQRVAERLRADVEALNLSVGGTPLTVSVTLGVATQRAGESAEQAIARADAALYEGKRGGRNRVVLA